MWCANCNQEVPAVASQSKARGSDDQVVCARCGSALERNAARNVRIDQSHIATGTQSATGAETPRATSDHPQSIPLEADFVTIADNLLDDDFLDDGPSDSDTWDEHGLMQARVAVNSYRVVDFDNNSVVERNASDFRRNDGPTNSAQTPTAASADSPSGSLLLPAAICIGLILLSLGGVLSIGALVTQRDALRQLGLPLLFFGQGILTLGVMLQLQGLWVASRKTHAVIGQLQKATAQLKRDSIVRDQINTLG